MNTNKNTDVVSSTTEELNLNGLTLIPVSDVDIKLDKKKTIGYDLTVENNYTFLTHDGIVVEDTLSCNPVLGDTENKECEDYLLSLGNVVDASGGLSTGINDDLCALTAYNLTRY